MASASHKKIRQILKEADLPKALSEDLKKELESHFYEKEHDLRFSGLRNESLEKKLSEDFGNESLVAKHLNFVHKKSFYSFVKSLMKKTTWLIVLLIASNMIWIIIALYQNDQIQKRSVDVYSLSGSNENWKVDNYQILFNKDYIRRKAAILTYLGNSDELRKVQSFSVDFYEEDPNYGSLTGKEMANTLTYAADGSSLAPFDMIENVKIGTGSTGGAYTYNETLKTKQHYENSYVKIKWKDLQGKSHEDRVDLNIVDHINSQDLMN